MSKIVIKIQMFKLISYELGITILENELNSDRTQADFMANLVFTTNNILCIHHTFLPFEDKSIGLQKSS